MNNFYPKGLTNEHMCAKIEFETIKNRMDLEKKKSRTYHRPGSLERLL